MREPYAVVLATAGSRRDAEAIADRLVEDRLAACVQLVAIDSVFRWKGEVERADEILLIIKTRRELYQQLEAAILTIHPYETPEIVLLEVAAGLPDYLAWIDEATAPQP